MAKAISPSDREAVRDLFERRKAGYRLMRAERIRQIQSTNLIEAMQRMDGMELAFPRLESTGAAFLMAYMSRRLRSHENAA